MAIKPPKPRSEAKPENRLSMRLSDRGVAVVTEHTQRMEVLTGAEVSRSQAIESLIAAGDLVWSAVQRSGSWSVTALIDAGERALAAELAAATAQEDSDE